MVRRIHYETIDSTNTEARRLAGRYRLSGIDRAEPLLVTAAEQFAGRGRNGRLWHSPLGGAWLSLAWPARKPPTAYSAISLAAAVGVLRGLRDVISYTADFRIKWPNDLLANDRKVAGILCEQQLRGARPEAIIIGVGVNVDFDAAEFPSDLRHPATTLRAAFGKEYAVETVIEAVGERLVEAVGELEADGLNAGLLNEIRDNLAYVGVLRVWSTATGTIQGRVAGIDDAGRLLLDTAAGRVACETGELAAAHEVADRSLR